jgi:hypothetical protein
VGLTGPFNSRTVKRAAKGHKKLKTQNVNFFLALSDKSDFSMNAPVYKSDVSS